MTPRCGSERMRGALLNHRSPLWRQRPVGDVVECGVGRYSWPGAPPLPVEESALACPRRKLNRQIECLVGLLSTSESPDHGGSRSMQEVVAGEVACQRVELRQRYLRTGRFREGDGAGSSLPPPSA